MVVVLTILELLRGRKSTLDSLRVDLAAPMFQWLNRREQNTQYADLASLEDAPDYRILAWYPLDFERVPGCPACGDFADFKARWANPGIAGVDATLSAGD